MCVYYIPCTRHEKRNQLHILGRTNKVYWGTQGEKGILIQVKNKHILHIDGESVAILNIHTDIKKIHTLSDKFSITNYFSLQHHNINLLGARFMGLIHF